MRRLKHVEAVVGMSSFIFMSLIYLTGLDQGVFALRMPYGGSSIALVATAVFLTLMSRYRRAETVVPLLKTSTVAVTAAWFIFYVLLQSAGLAQQWAIPLNLLQNIVLACLLFLWNYHYASLKEEDVRFEISVSVALVLFIFPLYAIFVTSVPWILIALLPLISAVTVVMTRFEISKSSKSGRTPLKALFENEGISGYRNRFFASRIAWGLSQGLAWGSMAYVLEYSASEPLHVDAEISSAISLTVLIAIALIFSRHRQKEIPVMFLSAIPFAMSFCLGAPLLQSNTYALAKLGMAIAWLCWAIQSFIQLRAYSQFLKIDALRLAFYEKGLTFLATLPGHFLAWVIGQIDSSFVALLGSPLVIMVFSYALVFISTLAIARHVMQRTQEANGRSFTEMTLQNNVRTISDQYGLTAREMQVFELMAEGYSRPYIEQTLFISKGTAKTHLYHIYQKLPVCDQDELLQLVADPTIHGGRDR